MREVVGAELQTGRFAEPRHEQDGNMGPDWADPDGQFRAADHRHHDIRDEDINLPAKLMDAVGRVNSTKGLDDPIVRIGEYRGNHGTDGGSIIGHHHCAARTALIQ